MPIKAETKMGEKVWNIQIFYAHLHSKININFHQGVDSKPFILKNVCKHKILYLPSMAYERKTNQKYDYTPLYPIETYSNVLGWINKNQE
jgi:hypothetical protein